MDYLSSWLSKYPRDFELFVSVLDTQYFQRHLPPAPEVVPLPTSFSPTQISQLVLELFRVVPGVPEMFPLHVPADGNCLYYSISALRHGGDISHHLHYRLHAAIVLATKTAEISGYANLFPPYQDPTAAWIGCVSEAVAAGLEDNPEVASILQQEAFYSLKPKNYSGGATLMACAVLSNSPIKCWGGFSLWIPSRPHQDVNVGSSLHLFHHQFIPSIGDLPPPGRPPTHFSPLIPTQNAASSLFA
jgi:hypothetical protein